MISNWINDHCLIVVKDIYELVDHENSWYMAGSIKLAGVPAEDLAAANH